MISAMKKVMDRLRTPGGMVAILGVICVLVGAHGQHHGGRSRDVIGFGRLDPSGRRIIIVAGLVMILLAARRARRDAGSNKTP